MVAALLSTLEVRAQSQEFFVPAPKENVPPPDAVPLPPEILAMPEDEARMKVIQRRSQLVIARSNIVRTAIADPSIADIVQFSPNEVSVIGLAIGSTTLTFWFEGNPDPLVYLLEVVRDPSLEDRLRADYGRLEKKIAVTFPNSKVYLIPLSGKVIVKGQARDSEEAARIMQIVRGEIINQNGSLAGPQVVAASYVGNGVDNVGINATDLASGFIVNMLDVPGEYQVALRVRMAEIKRQQLRRLGIDFSALINDRYFFQSLMGGAGGTLTGIFEAGDVAVAINWLASNGTAKILAEPNITVLSGHTASFISGGEFPVPTIVGINGVGGQQTQFRGFGVQMFVTPEVIGDMIRMQIIPEFSALNAANGANGIPGTNVRRVTTTVEMREGQTIALAGLLNHQTDTEVTRIPFLGELPVLGTLFSAKRGSMDETELLILVTPEIIRPMDAEEVPPVPGHEVVHPNDCDLYKYNRTEGTPDRGVYQLPPYGHNGGIGQEVGYTQFNPAPWQPNYNPGLGQGPFNPAVVNGGISRNAATVQTPYYNPAPQYTLPPSGGRYQQMPNSRIPQSMPMQQGYPMGQPPQVQPRTGEPAALPPAQGRSPFPPNTQSRVRSSVNQAAFAEPAEFQTSSRTNSPVTQAQLIQPSETKTSKSKPKSGSKLIAPDPIQRISGTKSKGRNR